MIKRIKGDLIMIVAIQSEPLRNGEIYRKFSIISLLTFVHNVNFNLFCWFSLHFQDVFFCSTHHFPFWMEKLERSSSNIFILFRFETHHILIEQSTGKPNKFGTFSTHFCWLVISSLHLKMCINHMHHLNDSH